MKLRKAVIRYSFYYLTLPQLQRLTRFVDNKEYYEELKFTPSFFPQNKKTNLEN